MVDGGCKRHKSTHFTTFDISFEQKNKRYKDNSNTKKEKWIHFYMIYHNISVKLWDIEKKSNKKEISHTIYYFNLKFHTQFIILI